MQSILVWNILMYLSLVLGIVCATIDNAWTQTSEVTIHNRFIGTNVHHENTQRTHIDGGPAAGDMLNGHYFPGLQDYSKGNYRGAANQMDYVIGGDRYLVKNPRKNEYISNAYYIRGMIYFYHASGGRRFVLAKEDFENSIRRNPKNYLSYLELSRVLSSLELRAEATSVLQRLLELQLGEQVAQQARVELTRLQSKKP